MLNLVYARCYTKASNGKKTFVYRVSGKQADLDKFQEIQGEYYRIDDDGTPVWFSGKAIGNRGTLIITKNNKIIPDMSEFDQMASLASQFGGNLGQSLADAGAQKLLTGMGSTKSAPVEEKPEVENVIEDVTENVTSDVDPDDIAKM